MEYLTIETDNGPKTLRIVPVHIQRSYLFGIVKITFRPSAVRRWKMVPRPSDTLLVELGNGKMVRLDQDSDEPGIDDILAVLDNGRYDA